MGMNTDTQHMAYVLREGQKDAPDGLKEGLRKSNRMQEIVLENMRAGKTGNEVLTSCLEQMEKEGIEGQIYCHPIGDWGHDAGAVMGEWVDWRHKIILMPQNARIHQPPHIRTSSRRTANPPQDLLQHRALRLFLCSRAKGDA